jgi:UDP-N-acetylmuramate dehydrogenase
MSELDVAGGGAPVLRGRFLYNEPMKKHVSWRAGGPAQRVYIPADLEDLIWLVRSVSAHEDIHVVGLGSNLLVRDGGVAGVVILLHGVLKELAIESRTHGLPPAPADLDTALVYAEAGVAAPKLARFAAKHDLVGAEFWAGIPGTVGGAIAMNAGCYGSETWDKLVQVRTLDRRGQLNERLPEEYVTGYRHVALKHPHQEWFIGAWFRLARGDGTTSRETIKALLKKRIESQPLNLPNAGSVFRNPPGDHAARLIEACGLKGFRIGGAQVSEKHANFIVNLGHASATDIERLIEHVEDCVEARTNVRLMREVRIIGERQ